MATAKKKTSAKRNTKTVKYAAKAQSSARQTSAGIPNMNWVSSNSADWQKGAQDWAKQSAKLYQLPFAQEDVNAATQQAAEQVKSATEQMVKMSADAMQQMFGQQVKASAAKSFDPSAFFSQAPQLDVEAIQEKMAAFVRESQEQLSKASQGNNRAYTEATELSRENIEALTEVCNIAVKVSKQLISEMTNYANKQFTQNVELSKQMLTCRTLNDMFDLSTRITKSNLDGFFSQSVKISEMLFQCATDVSEPLNERATETTERLAKAMTA